MWTQTHTPSHTHTLTHTLTLSHTHTRSTTQMERERESVLIVAHQAVLRALYGYFQGIPLEQVGCMFVSASECLMSLHTFTMRAVSGHNRSRPVLRVTLIFMHGSPALQIKERWELRPASKFVCLCKRAKYTGADDYPGSKAFMQWHTKLYKEMHKGSTKYLRYKTRVQGTHVGSWMPCLDGASVTHSLFVAPVLSCPGA